MKSNYLWDRSGKPDPEVQKLEACLAKFRFDRPAPEFPVIPVPKRQRWWERFSERSWNRTLSFSAVTAAVVLLAVAGTWWYANSRPAYGVVRLEGRPRVGGTEIITRGRLAVGRWLETDAFARAEIAVGGIGRVEVGPNSRIGLVRAHATEHRLALLHGSLHALIWAPPRLFFVDTPSAQAIDLGCEYTLSVDKEGQGELRVLSGWVAFEREGRESFVPAGFACRMQPGIGPGTPFRQSARPAFHEPLARLDFERAAPDVRAGWLSSLLGEAGPQDAVTLWHLLRRCGPAERLLVFDRLAELVPPPAGVTREGVLRLDGKTLDLWWDRLGLGGSEWWRMWKGPLPGSR
jgi:hypothetical protein